MLFRVRQAWYTSIQELSLITVVSRAYICCSCYTLELVWTALHRDTAAKTEITAVQLIGMLEYIPGM